eukprot:Gb_20663 [translate_table: standard]
MGVIEATSFHLASVWGGSALQSLCKIGVPEHRRSRLEHAMAWRQSRLREEVQNLAGHEDLRDYKRRNHAFIPRSENTFSLKVFMIPVTPRNEFKSKEPRRHSLCEEEDVARDPPEDIDFLDNLSELVGREVSLKLVIISQINPKSGTGKLSEVVFLQHWISTPDGLTNSNTAYGVTFNWDSDFGTHRAFIIRNLNHHQFFLKSLTLQLPADRTIDFICNSWVYPAAKYQTDHVFLSNHIFLLMETPPTLIKLRNEELVRL